MTGPDQPDGGDYGYDMAHEDTGKRTVRPPDADPAAPGRSGASSDPGSDYGYDEAHGS